VISITPEDHDILIAGKFPPQQSMTNFIYQSINTLKKLKSNNEKSLKSSLFNQIIVFLIVQLRLYKNLNLKKKYHAT